MTHEQPSLHAPLMFELPVPINIHNDLLKRVREITNSWGDHYYIPVEVDIVERKSGHTFVSVLLFSAYDHHYYFADVNCTRLERVAWGLEEDPYVDVEREGEC